MGKFLGIVVSALVIVGVIFGGFYFLTHRDSTSVTSDALMARLEDSSECTTQKLIYQGVVKMEKGMIPFIDKSSYVMIYTATVRAGFDMEAAEVNVTDDVVEVTIPQTEIQEITIDPDSIELYDTSFSIFTLDKESVKDALKKAEADAEEKAVTSGLLDAADENAEALIKGLLVDSVGDREIVVIHKKQH